MAAAACTYSEETESFVTCSICLCEFDGETRKPKFLPCAHTLCLECLKGIHKEFVITCPLCRKEFSYQDDVSSLPNNSYALHMLKLSEKIPEAQSKPDLNGKPAWCLTCGALAKPGCSVHSIIDVTGNTIKNFESLLKLRDELKKMRDHGQTKLALAIEKRKEFQAHLNQVSQCLNLVLHEVNQQEEENNIILVEMMSLLESNSPCLRRTLNPETSGGQDEDPLLSELISLVDDSNPEDSFDTLKEKMKKSLQLSESKLADAVAVAKTIQHQKKCRISVWLTDPKNQIIPTWDLLENGFNTYWPNDISLTPTKRDFLLLSHIVFSIQKRGIRHNKPTDDPPSDHKTLTCKKLEETSPSLTTVNPISVIGLNSPIEKFDLNKSTLIMTVRRHGNWKGSVHIKLSSSCNSQFIRKLGKICFRSPKQFSNTIGKSFLNYENQSPGHERKRPNVQQYGGCHSNFRSGQRIDPLGIRRCGSCTAIPDILYHCERCPYRWLRRVTIWRCVYSHLCWCRCYSYHARVNYGRYTKWDTVTTPKKFTRHTN